ncbi:hypothetical protein L6452_04208 [Arctium lappa]|uniref:Uncharacterized protein n=1 Tax=Arctium lappa TaxID=4217 RepID=A0ACB9FQA0_ARCLA|nr:hypothetical protein L6452_04208 [Arctium lappa]
MEKMVSSWCNTVKSVPQDYVFPEDTRPGDQIVPILKNCPMIDLEKTVSGDRNDVIRQVLQASQDFGFFQVINHGVCEDLIKDTIGMVKEFFNMPNEDKASIYSLDPHKSCRLYTSGFRYDKESIHQWRDVLIHFCHPLDELVDTWPNNPSKYRGVVGKFSFEVRNLSLRILEMIREGLELKPGYFRDELTCVQLMALNHYPPCPDPSVTLGLSKHSDRNIITILYQDNMCGFQVLKDGQWVGVEPFANAFVVNIGQQLKVINHGIDDDLVSDTMRVVKEFFDMSNEDKAGVYSEDPSKKCRLYTSTYDYENEEIHLWRDNLRHHCHPIDDFIHLWPEKLARYR